MPTKAGKPKVGEIWEHRFRLPPDWELQRHQVIVLEVNRGSYWSMRVADNNGIRALWVDAAYWFSKGELIYIGEAGPKTKKRFHLA
jgi:hypothetical protein